MKEESHIGNLYWWV